jgi:DNA (cytosine-5)-methyltransferase 1
MEKYGVPQKRTRVIFLATNVKKLIEKLNENKDIGFPKESKNIITVGEALSSINDNEDLQNHTFTVNEPETIIKIKHIPQGGYYEHLPKKLKTKKIRDGKEVIVKRYGSYLRRLHPDQPSKTITNNYIIHPTKDRYLSNREMAILHSFPKDYKFEGGLGSVSQQIANAVPPKFAEKMAAKVRELLDDYC